MRKALLSSLVALFLTACAEPAVQPSPEAAMECTPLRGSFSVLSELFVQQPDPPHAPRRFMTDLDTVERRRGAGVPDAARVIFADDACDNLWSWGVRAPYYLFPPVIDDANNPCAPRNRKYLSCKVRGHTNSSEPVLTNGDHDVRASPDTQQAILRFLNTAGRPK